MQNLYAAIVSMPSDRDARPVDNFEHLTIEYGGYAWPVKVPLGEFAQAHQTMTRVAETDDTELGDDPTIPYGDNFPATGQMDFDYGE